MKWVGNQHDHDPVANGPDLTEAIMARLGFERVEATEWRRLRRGLWVGRTLLLVALAGMAGIGVYAHSLSSRARVEHAGSIPAALGQTFPVHNDHALGDAIGQVGLFLSAQDDRTTPEKPRRRTDEQQSRIPVSETW